MRVDRQTLLEDVMWRGGTLDEALAETAVLAVLDELASLLPPHDAEDLAAGLPASLAKGLTPAERHVPVEPSDLYERLSATERVHLGIALEHARAACAALAEAFDPEQRILLARRLPPEWAELFAPPAREAAADIPSGTVPGHGHTLATGKPGSSRTLADSAPPAAQAESVASTANPHGDTKLSSATEVTGEPVATEHPSAEAPIAGAKDQRSRR